MMDTTRLDLVDLLKQVRLEMHNDVDARVTEKLDEAIAILEETEALTTDDRSEKAIAVLAKIGELLKYFPAIKALYESLK